MSAVGTGVATGAEACGEGPGVGVGVGARGVASAGPGVTLPDESVGGGAAKGPAAPLEGLQLAAISTASTSRPTGDRIAINLPHAGGPRTRTARMEFSAHSKVGGSSTSAAASATASTICSAVCRPPDHPTSAENQTCCSIAPSRCCG